MWYGCVVWLCGMVVWYGCVVWFCGTVMWYGCVVWLCVMVVWFGCVVWFGFWGVVEYEAVDNQFQFKHKTDVSKLMKGF